MVLELAVMLCCGHSKDGAASCMAEAPSPSPWHEITLAGSNTAAGDTQNQMCLLALVKISVEEGCC